MPRVRMLPQYVFMAWYLVKHRDNSTFLLLNMGGASYLDVKKWHVM
jgi:hypothetical protein